MSNKRAREEEAISIDSDDNYEDEGDGGDESALAKKFHLDRSSQIIGVLTPMFNNEKFSDLKVRFPKSNHVLHLHRMVICQSSDFFDVCLNSGMREANEGIVTMSEEDDEEVMTEMLKSCYSPQAKVLGDKMKIVPMIQLVQKYQFNLSLPTLTRYLINNIDVDTNIYQCLDLILDGNDNDVSKQVKQKMEVKLQRFAKRILEGGSYMALDFERWRKVLELMVNQENRLLVYDAVYAWLSHDAYNRMAYSPDLFSIVNSAVDRQPKAVMMQLSCFDARYCGGKAVLSKNNKRIKKNSGKGRNCAAMGTKCTKYSIRLIKSCTNLMVGMSPKQSFKKEGNNFNSSGWYLSCQSGEVYSQGDDCTGNRTYTQACNTAGTVIGVKLKNGELRFSVNSIDKGVAFLGLPNDVFPAFDMFERGCEFELL